METNFITISNKDNGVVLRGEKDVDSRLFVLKSCSAVPGKSSVQLAKSYVGKPSTQADLLWRLHLRHGHRNFTDVAPVQRPTAQEPSWMPVLYG
jgi:hypothetical protein